MNSMFDRIIEAHAMFDVVAIVTPYSDVSFFLFLLHSWIVCLM